jgi:hypothetical protein
VLAELITRLVGRRKICYHMSQNELISTGSTFRVIEVGFSVGGGQLVQSWSVLLGESWQ